MTIARLGHGVYNVDARCFGERDVIIGDYCGEEIIVVFFRERGEYLSDDLFRWV